MAEADAKLQNETIQQDEAQATLKYLEFVQSTTVRAIGIFWSIYDLAKESSGPLKPGVQTVEGAVKTVVGPVYRKFHDVPLDLLKLADQKVDGLVQEVDRHVPAPVKSASSHVYSAAHKAPELARSVTADVQRVGVVDTAAEITKAAYTRLEPTAKDIYGRYEPVAEQYAVSAWRSFNRLPLFPEVALILVPTAAYWSEKYNMGVNYMADKGYCVASYLPLVPTDRIAKVFGDEAGELHTSPSSSEVLVS